MDLYEGSDGTRVITSLRCNAFRGSLERAPERIPDVLRALGDARLRRVRPLRRSPINAIHSFKILRDSA